MQRVYEPATCWRPRCWWECSPAKGSPPMSGRHLVGAIGELPPGGLLALLVADEQRSGRENDLAYNAAAPLAEEPPEPRGPGACCGGGRRSVGRQFETCQRTELTPFSRLTRLTRRSSCAGASGCRAVRRGLPAWRVVQILAVRIAGAGRCCRGCAASGCEPGSRPRRGRRSALRSVARPRWPATRPGSSGVGRCRATGCWRRAPPAAGRGLQQQAHAAQDADGGGTRGCGCGVQAARVERPSRMITPPPPRKPIPETT